MDAGYSSRIGLVTSPSEQGRGGYILTRNLVRVLELATGGAARSGTVDDTEGTRVNLIAEDCRITSQWMLLRVVSVIIAQLKNAGRLLRLDKDVSVVFFTSGPTFFLSMMMARLLGKKVAYFISGLTGSEAIRRVNRLIYERTLFGIGGGIFPWVLAVLERLNYSLADVLVAESAGLARQIEADTSGGKPVANGALFVDTEVFTPKTELTQRTNTVGYFGALTSYKGVVNLFRAVPLILEQRDDVRFIIAGEGPALTEVEKYLREIKNGQDSKVDIVGKVSHEAMPAYLNESKLVVLPSCGEGLPNVILEAMACGAIVLATPVGAVPDLIKDAETGFIMEDNSPECIARNVIRVLNHPDIGEISRRARILIEKEFTCERAVARFRHILGILK